MSYLVVVLLTLFGCAHTTLISNMNLVFETFNPISMVRFFEFNDKGWNISAACIQEMFYYLDGLHRDVSWAVKLYDASGYYSGGLRDHNHIRPGNPELCRDLNAEFLEQEHRFHQQPIYNRSATPPAPSDLPKASQNQPPSGQPIPATVHQFRPFVNDSQMLPFGVRLVNAKYKMAMESIMDDVAAPPSGRWATIVQTVCMPSACGFDDLKQVMSYAHLPHMRNNAHVRHVELVELRLIQAAYTVWTDLSFAVIVTITSIIITLMSCASIFERFSKRKKRTITRPIRERFIASSKISFISHIHVTKVSNVNGNDNNSTLASSMKSLDPVLLDSLIVNDITGADKTDNIAQAKSLEFQPAAVVDVWNNNNNAGKPNAVADRRNKVEPAGGFMAKLFRCLSWSRNWGYFWGDACPRSRCDYKEEVPVVSGLRVLSCLSIIAVHLGVFLTQVSNNKRFEKQSLVIGTLLTNGSVTIDIYFFLSGISMAHLFHTTAKIIEVHQIGGAIDQLLLFASMILYKLIRLTFIYLVVLILLQLTMKHFHDSAVVSIPSEDHVTCQEHMWKNILYIDTFFPVTERCMIWSWYVSLEAQFCVIASIVLMLAKQHPRYASVISASFFTGSIVATTILRYNERTPQPTSYYSEEVGNAAVSYAQELVKFNGVYDQPWTRVSPYLLGLCLGYILHRSKNAVQMHIGVVSAGWLACLSLVVGFALKQLFVDKLSLWTRAAMASITHTIWSMILFWVVLCSVSPHKGPIGRFLRSPRWKPLSKLTNCVLLVHPLVTRWLILSMDNGLHMSLSVYVIMYIGFVVLTYGVAFVLFIIFEAPFATIFHVICNRRL